MKYDLILLSNLLGKDVLFADVIKDTDNVMRVVVTVSDEEDQFGKTLVFTEVELDELIDLSKIQHLLQKFQTHQGVKNG